MMNKNKKKIIFICMLVILSVFILSNCSEILSSDSSETYWINSDSNVRHNSSCRWYGNTNAGYYTTELIGTACGICGG